MQPYSAFDQFGKVLTRADDVNTRDQNLVCSKSSVICPECQKGFECEQSRAWCHILNLYMRVPSMLAINVTMKLK